MLIDWFTVAAQIINFLILVWLMKRFLYQPILQALDARERKIRAELADADNKRLLAQQKEEEFIRKNQEFEQQRAEMHKQAIEEVKAERLRLMQQARQDVEQLRQQQQQALKNQQQQFVNGLTRRTQSEIFAISRHALRDLANVDLEQHIVNVFSKKLLQLPDSEKQQLAATFKNVGTELEINTSFELQPLQINELTQNVQNIFGLNLPVRFNTSSHLICGIELSCDGQKISWTVASYLCNLETRLNEFFYQHADVVTSKTESTPEVNSNAS